MLNAHALANNDHATAGRTAFGRPSLIEDDSDTGVVTISAAEMVRLSGVGRERLRTWERRHGFPTPVRCENNVRRYVAEDVRHVIAVSRAVDRGVPLVTAIEQALEAREEEPTLASLGAALDHAPTPAIAVSGPEPLNVIWANGPTQAAPEAPVVGSDLLEAVPTFGAAAKSAIQRLLIGEGAETGIVTHTDWVGTFPVERRSIAWRIPPEASEEAVVVLIQLPEAVGAAGLPVPSVDQAAVWASATRDARRALQQESGLGSAQRALGELVRGTGGLDAFLATCHHGRLRTATSVRGTMPARTLELPTGCDIISAIGDGQIDWLGESSLRLLGAPSRSQAVLVPVISGGESIGAMVLMFPTELALPDLARELLLTLATTIGTVLQREHHAAAAEHARAA
ncbi:MAG: MerR family transcriptional regulator [Solirubrobacteraceae bacterium]|nr:MerR family transcriptional regulator [Solirubrobacteraceae bacterium]